VHGDLAGRPRSPWVQLASTTGGRRQTTRGCRKWPSGGH
jgi:hypothetical protein